MACFCDPGWNRAVRRCRVTPWPTLAAAVAWCDRINAIAPEQRSNAEWHYVLLGEDAFYGWRDKGGSVADLLAYARLRPVEDKGQAKFAF